MPGLVGNTRSSHHPTPFQAASNFYPSPSWCQRDIMLAHFPPSYCINNCIFYALVWEGRLRPIGEGSVFLTKGPIATGRLLSGLCLSWDFRCQHKSLLCNLLKCSQEINSTIKEQPTLGKNTIYHLSGCASTQQLTFITQRRPPSIHLTLHPLYSLTVHNYVPKASPPSWPCWFLPLSPIGGFMVHTCRIQYNFYR